MRVVGYRARSGWPVVCVVLAVLSMAAACAGSGTAARGEGGADEGPPAEAGADTADASGGAECPVRLGSVRPETGGGATFGQSLARGLEMGFDEVNAGGGVLGCEVELVAYDSQSVAANAASLTQRLISRDQVPIVLGSSISTETLAMMEITEAAQTPLYVPSAASALITSMGYEWVWRQSVIDSFAARLFGQYIANELGWETVGAIYENTDYGRPPVVDVLGPTLGESGSDLVAAESFNPGTADLSGQLLSLAGQEVDGVVFWGHDQDAAVLVRQNQELGTDLPLAGNTGVVYPAFLDLLSEEVQAETELVAVAQFVWTTDDPEAQEWMELFNERYGVDPDAVAIDGYDAAFVLKAAIESAGGVDDPEAVQAALNEVEYDGVGGHISFNENGQAIRPLMVAELTPKDGPGFTVVETIEPTASDYSTSG